mgnify:FL=1
MTRTDGLDFEIIMAVSLAGMLKAPESISDVGNVYSDAVAAAGRWTGGKTDYGKMFNGSPTTTGGSWPGGFPGQAQSQPNNGGRGLNAKIWGASIGLDSPTLKAIALRTKNEQYPKDGV